MCPSLRLCATNPGEDNHLCCPCRTLVFINYHKLSCKVISVTPKGGHGTFQNEGGGQKPMAFLSGMFPYSPRVGGAEVNLWLPVTGCWGGRVKDQPAFINRAFLKFHKLRRSSNRKSHWTSQRSTNIPSLNADPFRGDREKGVGMWVWALVGRQ